MAEKYCLVGVDGNAFEVMGYVRKAMRRSGFEKSEIDAYTERAMSGDYDNLLCVSMEYVDKCNERVE